MVLANLVGAGYRGAVLPVNPAAAQAGELLEGLAPLASSAQLPAGVDLAVVCLPREQALPEIETLARRGVRAAIVLAAGFRETGRQGFLAEQELTRIAGEAGMLLLGPNSLGLINTACNLNVKASLKTQSGQLPDIGFSQWWKAYPPDKVSAWMPVHLRPPQADGGGRA